MCSQSVSSENIDNKPHIQTPTEKLLCIVALLITFLFCWSLCRAILAPSDENVLYVYMRPLPNAELYLSPDGIHAKIIKRNWKSFAWLGGREQHFFIELRHSLFTGGTLASTNMYLRRYYNDPGFWGAGTEYSDQNHIVDRGVLHTKQEEIRRAWDYWMRSAEGRSE